MTEFDNQKGCIMGNSLFERERTTDGLDIFFWVFHDKSSYVATHWHNAIEIMYIFEGQVDVTVNNQTTILVPGDVFLLDSTVPHSTKSVRGNAAVLIQIPYRILEKYIPNINSFNFAFDCHTNDSVLRTKILKLTDVIKQMQIVFEINPDGGILRFNSLVYELLYQLYHHFGRNIPEDQIRRDNKDFKRIELVLKYSNENYAKQISLSEISSVACFQEDYFCHFFKKNMGTTYTQYLNELRLSHIYHDLIGTDLPLKTILEKHGFHNYKLFSKMFYADFKMTPMQYRKLYLSSPNPEDLPRQHEMPEFPD